MKKYTVYCIALVICMVFAAGCGKAAESEEQTIYGQGAESGEQTIDGQVAEPAEQTIDGQNAESEEQTIHRQGAEPAEKTIHGQGAEAETPGENSDGNEKKVPGQKEAANAMEGTSGEGAETGDMVSGAKGGSSASGSSGGGSREGTGDSLTDVVPGNTGAGVKSGMPGALHVSGTQLVDTLGNPVQLRGISTHGLAWYPEYVNEECFREFREEWGMNLVRLAMYTGESGGYCTGGNRDDLKKLVKDGVAYATDCGMYVIIDWHILSDGNPNTYLEEAKAFFGEMAETYAEYTNVLYEICNEPNGGTSWSDVKKYAEQVIEVIREKDEDGIILVGTPNWCQYVEQAAADPVSGYENIMYTLHFYAATHTDSLRDAMVKAVGNGLPVFVSEYGICDASGSGAIDTYQADKWMELLDEYGISSVTWNLSNKSETSAILKSSCGKVSGFTKEDLSDSGKWLYERMMVSGGSAVGAHGEAAGTGNVGNTGMGNAGIGNAGNTGMGNAGTGDSGGTNVETAGAAGDMGMGSVGTGNPGGTSAGQAASGSSGTAGGNPGKPDKTGSAESGGDGSGNGGSVLPSSTKTPGNAAAVSDGLNITAKVTNSWGQGSDSHIQYELSISNPTETARSEWKIQLTFSSNIALENGWNGVYEAEGDTLTISSMDYNGFIDKNGSVENIGFIIKTEEGCRLEE